MERFEGIVEAAKEQELEIAELEEKLAQLKKARKMEVRKVPGAVGVSKTQHAFDERQNHDDTGNFKGVTKARDADGSEHFHVNVYYVNPDTGRYTSVGGRGETLADVVLLRNDKAGMLLREGLIDFERYLGYVQG